jgi:hypothetical protein
VALIVAGLQEKRVFLGIVNTVPILDSKQFTLSKFADALKVGSLLPGLFMVVLKRITQS